MTMWASVAAGMLAITSLFPGGMADATTDIPEDSPWYTVDQGGTAQIHLYYAYSST